MSEGNDRKERSIARTVTPADACPEPNSGRKLLIRLFGNYHRELPRELDTLASNEVLVWQWVDQILSEREAFVLKHIYGQVGRCHTLDEIASVLPRADGTSIGVTRERVRQIEARALRLLRHPTRSRRLFRLVGCAAPDPVEPPTRPSQRLLREVFGYDEDLQSRPNVDDSAADEAGVWQLVDEVLSQREALVLKYRFGQAGVCHTVNAIARILPRADGTTTGMTGTQVREIEQKALGELRCGRANDRLLRLAKGQPPEPPINASQRLLRAVFGNSDESPDEPEVDDHAVDEAAVWYFVDEYLSETQAFVLKYRFGRVGRCHGLEEVARLLPWKNSTRVGARAEVVREIEEEALQGLGGEPTATRLRYLVECGPSEADLADIGLSSDQYQMPLEELGLSPRVYDLLRKRNFVKVGELLQASEGGPLWTRVYIGRFGEKAKAELRECLLRKGLPLNERTERFEIGPEGQDFMSLVRTSEIPVHAIMDICPDSLRALVCMRGGKGRGPTVSLYDLLTDKLVWQLAQPEVPPNDSINWPGACYCVPGGTFILEYGSGEDVAPGSRRRFTTKLHFLDSSGSSLRETTLAGKLSRVITHGPGVLVGCEDGFLYAYSEEGIPLWSFKVPGDQGRTFDGSVFTPYPYLVEASARWEGIAVNSLNNVYLLDQHGTMRSEWSRRAAHHDEKGVTHDVGSRFRLQSDLGKGTRYLPLVRALAASPDGDRYAVLTDDGVIDVLDRRLSTVSSWEGSTGDPREVLFLDNNRSLVVRTHSSVDFYRDSQLVGQGIPYLKIARFADRYAVLHGQRFLEVVDVNGKKIVGCEFSTQRAIKFVGSILVVATADGVHLFDTRMD